MKLYRIAQDAYARVQSDEAMGFFISFVFRPRCKGATSALLKWPLHTLCFFCHLTGSDITLTNTAFHPLLFLVFFIQGGDKRFGG
jgi:hypothetical protein